MKKSVIIIFYLCAFAAVSYFLRTYLNAPKSFIISLIISLAIILLLIQSRSKYVRPIGITLLVMHTIRLIGIFIPVYNEKPDIRQRYRRHPSMLRADAGSSSGMQVSLSQLNGQTTQRSSSALMQGVPVYQGNTITVAGNITTNERMLLTLRDKSLIQILPQTSLTIETLAPDFASLTGSRIGLTMDRGIMSMHTFRKSYTPQQRYVKAGETFFSCKSCIIALSGNIGSIASSGSIMRWIANGEIITLSGGVYTFGNNAVTASSSPALVSVLQSTNNSIANRERLYENTRQDFIQEQWGRAMDTSYLLSTISKIKMALVGLADWTYWEKYDNLALYEYLRDQGEELPPPFANQKHLYEFVE